MSATLEPELQPAAELSPVVRQKLAALRSRIRGYVWYVGISACLVALLVGFWILLGVDWWFEPSLAARQAMLVAAGMLLAWVAWRYLIDRLAVPLSDESMALLLERRYPQVQDSLLTAVELADRQQPTDPFAREMLANTCWKAQQQSADLSLSDVLDYVPLRRWLACAALACIASVAAAVLYPEVLQFGARRLALLTDEPWPRTTRLVVEGFENGEAVVAKGDNLQLVVKADTAMAVPATVEVRYRYADGARGRERMIREGTAEAPRDPYQLFRHVFQGIPSDMQFDVRGGDAVVRNLRVRVVDSPTIELLLDCQYPEYMQRSPRQLPVAGIMAIERGTRVRVVAQANKELVEARVDYPTGNGTFGSHTIHLPDALESTTQFEFVIEQLLEDTTLGFTLFDTDGIRNREPIRLTLVAVADQPPQIGVQLTGIGRAITPQARLPLVGELSDDHGIDRAWIEYTVDELEPRQQPMTAAPNGRTQVEVSEAFEVRPLELRPGQKLLVGVKAADRHSLADEHEPNVGQGERYLLDVVTPEQLRAMLETQELSLRQRFETIMGEVLETRDSLARLEGDEFSTAAPPVEGQTPGRTTVELPAAEGDEPDAPVDPQEAARRTAGRNRLRVERALQNARKNGEETLGVATSFDAIRAELINNRVDTEELRIRLKDYIADPLRDIGNGMFEPWQRNLAQLMRQLAAEAPEAQRSATHREALAQADAILVAMAQVRDKMLELETFNEALDLLRSILASQKELNERTQQERAQQLRRLLED